MHKIQIAILLVSVLPTSGKVIYVDTDAAGANNGTSWVDSYNYLQDALAEANSVEKPVEIRVAQGVYKPDQGAGIKPGDRQATFHLINGVTLKGGYAGFAEPDPNARDITLYETILSGDLAGNDVNLTDPCDLLDESTRAENSYHVVTGRYIKSRVALDGFTIMGGNGNGRGGNGGGRGGDSGAAGGIRLSGVWAIEVRNCTFTGNSGHSGGALIADDDLTLTNCTFRGNVAHDGGGIYNNCNNLRMLSCSFKGNQAKNRGGGIYNYYSIYTLTNCTFNDNSAREGGGMSSVYGYGNTSLTNCTFIGNSASERGGGMCFCSHHGSQKLINCTISANSATNGNALACDSSKYHPGDLQITNCILWNGGSEISNDSYSTIAVDYSDVQNGQESVYDPSEGLVWGEGNIDADPCFADANNCDYHLKSHAGRWDPNSERWIQDNVTSLCIDAGDPTSPIGHEPFPNGGIINMGAYGGTAEASKSYFGEPVCQTIVAGDINGDCKVDFTDFGLMALHWLDNRAVNRKIIDGIEFYIQTNKSIYYLGENVQMAFRITNLTAETVHIGCSRSGEFNLLVQEDHKTIWAWAHGWYWFSPGIELSAGESIEISHNWDMKDDNGYLVEAGTYKVVGVMYNEPWNHDRNPNDYAPTEVRVSITIFPKNSS